MSIFNMKENRYNVYIDKKYWGQFSSTKNEIAFQAEMQEQLKHLHALNMSEEGAIEYRKRYENATVYVYFTGEKILHLDKKD